MKGNDVKVSKRGKTGARQCGCDSPQVDPPTEGAKPVSEGPRGLEEIHAGKFFADAVQGVIPILQNLILGIEGDSERDQAQSLLELIFDAAGRVQQRVEPVMAAMEADAARARK